MKLLAFISDFFTPMLPSYYSFILSPLYSSLLLCFTTLLLFLYCPAPLSLLLYLSFLIL
ncbi:hypothetical protein PPACK8108_LOCUS20030 [Phakopsora pachyrhizi]|uniref:Uncharacterized protein n=1 Tax=Phakopsora pachyrhizi TaxID=170000 RepID=A0AAV0BE09_PHAPC|nr:hypothetical protein PPACK8108_LOCUS20030 [Phakopsora pachyrhizi]